MGGKNTVNPMTQKILPVFGTGNRVLGIVPLGDFVTFNGDEEVITINNVVYPIEYFAMRRMSDMAPVQMMRIFMDATQEKVGMQNHLPDFASITENTPATGWVVTRSVLVQPSYYMNSTWSKFLGGLDAQPESILE